MSRTNTTHGIRWKVNGTHLTSKRGDIFAGSPRVSIFFVGDVKVPELYREEELEEMAKDETKASLLIRKVFTTEVESAMARGRVKKVTSEWRWKR